MRKISVVDKLFCHLYNPFYPKYFCRIAKKILCGKGVWCCKDCEEQDKCEVVCKIGLFKKEKEEK